MNDRRVRTLSLPAHTVLDHFRAAACSYSYLSLPRFCPLPAGYRVLSVTADWLRHSVDFLIEHPTFDPVPAGDLPPTLTGMWTEWETVELKREGGLGKFEFEYNTLTGEEVPIVVGR